MTDSAKPDAAAQAHAMYLAHCAACERAGVPAPSPAQWVEAIDRMIRDGIDEPPETY